MMMHISQEARIGERSGINAYAWVYRTIDNQETKMVLQTAACQFSRVWMAGFVGIVFHSGS
jgi:hypothetical protein